MSLDNVSVFLDKYGFVQNAMIAGEPPEGSIFAPPVNGFQELFDYAFFFENGAWSTIGPSPGVDYVLDKVNKVWILDIEGAKARKLAQFKADRNRTEFGPFTYNGMTFDGDANAQRRLSGLVSAAKSAIAAGQTFTKEFTLADNSVVQLTAEDFIGIEMAKLWQVDVAFQEYRLKKAAIEAATTIEELEAITI